MPKGRSSVTRNGSDVRWSLNWSVISIRYTTVAGRDEFENYLERILTHPFLTL